ncbi:galectin-5-like [Tiliqua scincoides]|uniref:galectin-5-like n=1 Tax=Tiliqua scincoides TaxID=71010 RepID=UPI003461B376
MGAGKSLVETQYILGTLEEGRMILIKARVASSAKRFSIDLTCSNGDIAFHFNPRFDESPPLVVCNTWTYMWWKAERTSRLPFRKGESFEMTITVRSAYYVVSVNGKHFLRYEHRLPYHTVKKLEFRGDISVEEVIQPSEKGPPPADEKTAATWDLPPANANTTATMAPRPLLGPRSPATSSTA